MDFCSCCAPSLYSTFFEAHRLVKRLLGRSMTAQNLEFDYLAVEPNLVLIYVGWNHTIARADPRKNEWAYRQSAVYRILYHFFSSQRGITLNFSERTFYEPQAPEIQGYRDYRFDYDIADLLVPFGRFRRIHESSWSRWQVYWIGGPNPMNGRDKSRIRSRRPRISTPGPLLTKSHNEQLRAFAREHEDLALSLILRTMRGSVFGPGVIDFGDSVHLTPAAYLEMGTFVANQLTAIGVIP